MCFLVVASSSSDWWSSSLLSGQLSGGAPRIGRGDASEYRQTPGVRQPAVAGADLP